MRKGLHRFGVIAAAAAAVGVTAAPASAEGALVLTGSAEIACFGCGASQGSAQLTVAGVHDGTVIAGPITARYVAQEGGGATCAVSGVAQGSYSGVLSGEFSWTRVGAVAVVSLTGEHNGAGVVGFLVTSPLGAPCGQPITATLAGVVNVT